jgi:beta-N-acetylhexosaminidase
MSATLFVDIEGLALQERDRVLLANPFVSGLILFARNYADPGQLGRLCEEIRALRSDLVISVDQEGGRVQRFEKGFTRLPHMRALGLMFEEDPAAAVEAACEVGRLMATELLDHGVDLSFAPVLDLAFPESRVIANRGFSENPDAVIQLAGAWIDGMNAAGMAAVGKHFPGHGSVEGDTHHESPVDHRPFEVIESLDMRPFAVLAPKLGGMMLAHVVYEAVDGQPAGFSRRWQQGILREQLGFDGVIFSDDLSMSAAGQAGCYVQRAQAAIEAGCQVLLACNHATAAGEILEWMHKSNIRPFDPVKIRSIDVDSWQVDARRRAVSLAGDLVNRLA